MPHVTMLTPSTRPGAGFADPELWYNRVNDSTSVHLEFDGMKGRSWLMKRLPARAYDNGIYVVFSNPIGMDDDQLKNGCSMILDPFGDILAECRALRLWRLPARQISWKKPVVPIIEKPDDQTCIKRLLVRIISPSKKWFG